MTSIQKARKTWRKKKRAMGACVDCGKPAKGHARCFRHRVRQAQLAQMYRVDMVLYN